jgi:hypothetical protein
MATTTTLDLAEIVFIPTPVEHAQALIALRNERMAAGSAAATPGIPTEGDDEVAFVTGQGPWRRTQLEALRDWISDNGRRPPAGASYRALHTLFDLTAEADGDWVTKADAEQAAGVAPRQLQNELAALTKLGRKITNQKSWPIEWRKLGRTFSYRMDPQIAEWWKTGQEGDPS